MNMEKIMGFFQQHGTKVLGGVGGTLAVVTATTGIVPDAHMKYYMLAIGLCTFWRGFVNSANQP